MKTKIKGIVLAGNYEQYKEWCKRKYFNLEEYTYVSEPKDLKGIHNVPVYYVGTYWNNCMWGNIDIVRNIVIKGGKIWIEK